MSALESRKTHHRKLTKTIEKVCRHFCVERAHIRKITFEPVAIAEFAIQCGTLVGAHQRDEIADQSIIADKIAFQSKCSADETIKPFRAKRSDRFPKYT